MINNFTPVFWIIVAFFCIVGILFTVTSFKYKKETKEYFKSIKESKIEKEEK